MSLMVCYRLWKWYVTALCNPVKLPKTICNRSRQPLMETERPTLLCGSSICQPFMEMAGKQSSNLWDCAGVCAGYVTALCNPVKLPKTICNRLWKRYVTAYLVTYPVMQPLMETVLVLPKSLEPLHLFSRKASQYQ
jgi:hypothetical protein